MVTLERGPKARVCWLGAADFRRVGGMIVEVVDYWAQLLRIVECEMVIKKINVRVLPVVPV